MDAKRLPRTQKLIEAQKFKRTKRFNLSNFFLYKKEKKKLNGPNQRLLSCHIHLITKEKAHATFIKKMPLV